MQAELKAVRTAAHSTEVVDGFRVLHSANVGDTFRLYAQLHKRIEARLWLPASPPACPPVQITTPGAWYKTSACMQMGMCVGGMPLYLQPCTMPCMN